MKKTSLAAGLLAMLSLVSTTQATTRYVSLTGGNISPYTNWTQAATTIQAAVNLSQAGDTVIVTNGNYTVSSEILITNGITLTSLNGYASTAIVGAYPVTTNRCLHLKNASALVSGFTITNGCVVNYTSGGGIFIENGGTVVNCLIIGNKVDLGQSFGGGVYLLTSGTVSNCIIRNNRSLDGTYGSGGGVYVRDGGLITDCTISGNTSQNASDGGPGGGGLIWGGTIQNCVVANNSVGGLQLTHSATARNCLIVSNNSSTGGGFLLNYGSTVDCCTVYGNYATGYGGPSTNSGGGVYFSDTQSIVLNSIIWSNRGIGGVLDNWDGFATNFSRSCTTPLPVGLGNIAVDPLFVGANATPANFSLQPGSPCIDAGTNKAWMTSAVDLDGRPRISGASVDLGAYEWGIEVQIRFSAVDVVWDSILWHTYQPQWSTNLVSGIWSNLGSSVYATSTTSFVVDWIRDGAGKSYRVQDVTP